MFARVVVTASGEHELAADRADVDDASPPLLPHPGQDELTQPHQSEEVRLELTPHLVDRDGLDSALHRIPRVVHERPDGAVLGLHRGDGGAHRLLVVHIEGERPSTLRLQVREGLGAPRRRVDRPVLTDQALGSGPPDTCRATRDEDGPGCVVSHASEPSLGSRDAAAYDRFRTRAAPAVVRVGRCRRRGRRPRVAGAAHRPDLADDPQLLRRRSATVVFVAFFIAERVYHWLH